MLNARSMIGTHDILFVTLDTLRYDVAQSLFEGGKTPSLEALLPQTGWERRHTPGSFTYAAHHAFFAGFLPTPSGPGPHPRLFATTFPGSETIDGRTAVFDAADIVTGLAQQGYRTCCIGGVGFFNQRSALGSVLPNLFEHREWSEDLGVTSSCSTERQVDRAIAFLRSLDAQDRAFIFLNVSAVHQPNCIFHADLEEDSAATQAAALEYADGHLGKLIDAVRRRSNALCVMCSDHGTAYGEDGYHGHRLAHSVVWEVPYLEVELLHDA